jgi:hypothetical protein
MRNKRLFRIILLMKYNYQYEKKNINTIRLRNKIEKNWKKIICLWFNGKINIIVKNSIGL